MAQIVLGAVGAIVGGYFGGPTGAQAGWAIGTAIGGAVEANQQKVVGPRLSDLKVIGSAYGTPIPWATGTPRIAGQLWWASDKREIGSTSGGKGGGPSVTNFTYEMDCLIGLTDGEIGWVSRIWWNGKLVYNVRDDATDGTVSASATSEYWRRLTVYPGTDSQLPDPTYEAAVGVDQAPAYRGRGCVFIEGMQLGNSGQLPNLTLELAISGGGEGEVVLLMQFDGDMVDEAGHTFAYDGPIHIGSGKFDGGVDINGNSPGGGGSNVVYSATTSNDWDLNASDFTIDGWMLFKGVPTRPRTLCRIADNSSADGRDEYGIVSDGLPAIFNAYWPIDSSTIEVFGIPYTIDSSALNIWHHLRFCRSGNDYYFFVNGQGHKLATRTYRRAAGAKKVFIGNSRRSFDDAHNGLIDGLRVVRGFAISTANFTPPTAPPGYLVSIASMTPLPSVRATVESLCLRSGLDSSKFDASALDDIDRPVRAFVQSQAGDTRALLEQLMAAFFFTAALSDKLYFYPRANGPVAMIDFDELAAGSEQASDQPLSLSLAMDLEIPSQMAVSYANMAADYQTGTEYSDRILSGQPSVNTLELAIGLLPEEAKQIADVMLADAMASSVSTSISLPLKYSRLEASDVIDVLDDGGGILRLRLTNKRDDGFVLNFDASVDDADVVVADGVTDSDYRTASEVFALATTVLYALDIALLRDQDDGLGYYAAARGEDSGWQGASLLSSANDIDYSQAANMSQATVMGSSTTILGNWAGGSVMDELNTVTVILGEGQLSSTTRDGLFADETLNAMVIGNEIIRFTTASLLSTSPNVYQLSRLLRGQRGTDWACTGHAVSERAVLLNDTTMRRISQQIGDIGTLLYLKGVTFGSSAVDVDPQSFTPHSISQKPFSPVDLRVTSNSSGAAVVTWKRRTRLTTRLVGSSGISAPLGESSEAYDVEVRDGSSTLVQTQRVVAPVAAISVATVVKTYAEGVAWPLLSSGTLYGVQVEGLGTRYLLKQNSSGVVIGTSFALGDAVLKVDYSATAAYVTSYFESATVPTYLIRSLLTRIDLSDLSTVAAQWDAQTIGDAIYGSAYDGTNVWTIGNLTGTLRKHNATTLAVISSWTLGTSGWKVAAQGGRIFAAGVNTTKVVAFDPVGSPTIVWTVDLGTRCVDVLCTSGLVFVSTATGLVVLNIATGATVTSYTDGTPLTVSSAQGLSIFGSEVVYRPYSTNSALGPFRFLSSTTGLVTREITIAEADVAGGSVNGNLFGVGSPTRNYNAYLGYEFTFASSLTGYTITVYQVSTTVGRGYPASITL